MNHEYFITLKKIIEQAKWIIINHTKGYFSSKGGDALSMLGLKGYELSELFLWHWGLVLERLNYKFAWNISED